MMVRLLFVVSLLLTAAVAGTTSAVAVDAPPPTVESALLQALFPEDIFHPVDLDTFSYELRRELTGSAAERVRAFYVDSWEKDFPAIVPQRVDSAPFVVEWAGDYENPGRFAQALRLSGSPNIYTEWFVGDEGRARYRDNALINISNRDLEVRYWWDSFAGWLENHGDAVTCGGSARLVNDEQSIRCTASILSREARVELIAAAGLPGRGYTETVSRLTFELWITRNDSIPVLLDIQAAGIDEYGDRFTGTFRLDLFDLDDEDIQVDLPRS